MAGGSMAHRSLRVVVGGKADPSVPSLTDEQIVEAVEMGDGRLAEQIYDRLVGVVDGTLYRVMGRREADHDDLVQSAFEQIILTISRRKFARACSLKAWAATLASHVALNALRSRCRERKVVDRWVEPDGEAHDAAGSHDVERQVGSRRELDKMREHLARMDQGRALGGSPVRLLGRRGTIEARARQARAGGTDGGQRSLPPKGERVMNPSPADHLDLLRRLGVEPIPSEEPGQCASRRAVVAKRMREVLREEGGRRSRRTVFVRWAWTAAALAAALCLVVTWPWLAAKRRSAAPFDQVFALTGSVGLLHNGVHVETAAEPVAISSGDDLVVSRPGTARIKMAQGADVELAAGTRLGVASTAPQSTSLRLELGRVDVQVPKLGPSGSFRVATPHAEVVVHGTRFSVEVGERGQAGVARVVVKVSEGRVGVKSHGAELMLEAGEEWTNIEPASTATAAHETPSIAAAPAIASPQQDPAPRIVRAAPSDPPLSQASSTLAEENRLFRSAVEARRRGDDEEAVRQWDLLLSRYPNSTLAQEARVERFRSLKKLGRDSAAAQEARRYLAEHPNGFAQEEARGVALPPAPAASR
jgi:RNA polymerase sigma-70 factor (ECF subfamily)